MDYVWAVGHSNQLALLSSVSRTAGECCELVLDRIIAKMQNVGVLMKHSSTGVGRKVVVDSFLLEYVQVA